MLILTLKERCKFYADDKFGLKYPASIPRVGADDRIYGNWMIGQDYRSKAGYYGEYPRSYLERMATLFPDAEPHNTLHLFSGSVKEGVTLDIIKGTEPTQWGDGHYLTTYFPKERFDLIMADPPYSIEDAKRYGTPMVDRNKVMKEAELCLAKEGMIVWLDQVFPMFSRKKDSKRYANLDFVGWISVVRSTNHRVRCAFFFKKKTEWEDE